MPIGIEKTENEGNNLDLWNFDVSSLKSKNKKIQTTLYFSLFLIVFPVVTFFWNIWFGRILVSPPLVLMICCGFLSFRAAKTIEKKGVN